MAGRHEIFRIFIVMVLLFWAVAAEAVTSNNVQITATDPVAGEALAVDQQLFIRIKYGSESPLRFLLSAYLHGEKLSFGYYSSQPELYDAGQEEALAWIGFSNVTHIDEIRVAVLNTRSEPIDEISYPFEFSWRETAASQVGKRAEWVERLQHQQEWRRGYTFDPAAQNKDTVYDLLFYLNSAAIPFYLLMQVYALRKFRGRWRELATIPMLSMLPLVLGSIIGFGTDLRYWVILIFRGIPFALLYLLLLWSFRWKTNKAASGQR